MINTLSHHDINRRQYDDKSRAYLTSQIHAQGAEFAKMRTLLTARGSRQVLDLGCGGGHVSYQIAPVVDHVIAYDLSASMVDTVIRHAGDQGLTNITGRVGSAEQLPFGNGQFDAVISRYSAHHWQSVPEALTQIFRVLADDGVVVIFDVLGNGHPILNNFLQTIETIRDPSHVRDYSLAEWCTMVETAGFCVQTLQKDRLFLDFTSWTARMCVPAPAVDTLRLLQHHASDLVRRYFDLQTDGSFTTDTLYLVLTKM